MLLSRAEIIDLIKSESLRFDPPIDEKQIGICSIDIRLGQVISKFKDIKGVTITPSLSESHNFFDSERKNVGDTIHLKEHDFLLAQTYEKIFLPNDIAATVEGRSTYARWGLSAHVTAPLIEPSFFGNITLEMYNHGKFGIDITVGKDTVCQLIFYRVSSSIPSEVIDAFGRYRGQSTPEPGPYHN
jgi:dCTP deaminase